MEEAAVECSLGDGRRASRNFGEGELCVGHAAKLFVRFGILSQASQPTASVRGRWIPIAAKLLFAASILLPASGCTRKPDNNTVVVVIESSPTNLDPRVGIDAQSERIDELIFDSLVRRDEHFDLKPWLAESWEIPDPQT